MIVSGLGCWGTGLVTPALDLSFWSWACGPASFLMRNYNCFWNWMLGHRTCHSSVGLVILRLGLWPSLILNKKNIVSGLGCWEKGLVTPASDLSANGYSNHDICSNPDLRRIPTCSHSEIIVAPLHESESCPKWRLLGGCLTFQLGSLILL